MSQKNSLIKKIFWSNISVITVVLVLAIGVSAFFQHKDIREQIDQSIREFAVLVSEEPSVRQVFVDKAITDQTMAYLDAAISNNRDIDYIVLADENAIRYYHPDHSMIGQHFQGGDEGPALEGSEMYITEGKGSRENQRRCFISIKDDDGKVLGFIMVSRYSKTIHRLMMRQLYQFILIFIAAMMFSILISVILANTIRKQLLGYEPSQIARMFLQREEVLDGLTDGILLVNDRGECEYANEAAGRIFGGKNSDKIQSFVDEYVKESIISQEESLQETIRAYDATLLMDILPVLNNSVYVGSLVVLNDKTESIKMAAQLTGVDQIIGALRASTHETKNRMHVILGLLQIGELDEAIDFIQSAAGYDEEADHIRMLILNNTLAALLIGKRNRAKELGIDLIVRKDSYLGKRSRFLTSAELVTITGNLIENAFDAIAEKDSGPKEIILYINETDDMLIITSDDTGCGMTPEQVEAVLRGGYTSKGENHGIGMGLIRNILKGSGGTLDIESEPGEGTSISVTVHRKEDQND